MERPANARERLDYVSTQPRTGAVKDAHALLERLSSGVAWVDQEPMIDGLLVVCADLLYEIVQLQQQLAAHASHEVA